MAGFYHEFLSEIRNSGVAKTSHFSVTIPIVPSALDASIGKSGRLFSLRCEATELPGKQLVTQENRIYGPVYKTVYQTIYQDLILTFLDTEDLFIRRFFEAWINTVFDVERNRVAYPDSYRSEIQITQFLPIADTKSGSSSLEATATWHLFKSFPTAVNQMPVSWTEDGFHRTAVTLAYEYYQISTPSTPKKQLIPPAKGATQQKQGSKQ